MIFKNKSIWFAWILCGVVILGALLLFLSEWNNPALHADPFLLANRLTSALFPIAFSMVGALILSRLVHNRIGWLLMASALPVAVLGPLTSYIGSPPSDVNLLTARHILVIWLNNWGWWLLIGPFLLILLIFPTGQLLSPRWRWVIGLMAMLFAVFVVIVTIAPKWTDPATGMTFPNPLGLQLLPADFSFETIQTPWVLGLVSTAALCVSSVVIRYRRAHALEREQLKWFLYTCILFIVTYAGISLWFTDEEAPAWMGVIFNFTLASVPVSIGIAILRYRLWDIDIIIRRTLQYSLLSGLLALTYLGLITVLQSVFRSFSGQQSEISIVLSTLAIAALFFPLRNRVQEFIDKRFYRKKYDAQKVLAEFAATCRDETDLDKLVARLAEVIDETLQPEKVSVWLKPDSRGSKSQVDF